MYTPLVNDYLAKQGTVTGQNSVILLLISTGITHVINLLFLSIRQEV